MYATATGYHGGLCRQDGVYCFALLVMVRTKRSEKSGLTGEPVYVTAKDGQIIARSSGGEAGEEGGSCVYGADGRARGPCRVSRLRFCVQKAGYRDRDFAS